MAVDPTTTPYSGNNDFPETSYLPTDATEGESQTFNTPYQALFDRTTWLRARLLDPPLVPLFGAKQADGIGTTVVERFIPWPTEGTGRAGWLQFEVVAGTTTDLWWAVQISPAVTVTMVAASIMGDDGPGTNPGFPAASDRPVLKLYRQPIDGGDASLLVTQADETTSKAEYEAHHTLPLDPSILYDPPLVFLPGEYLLIRFSGHKGANVGVNTLKLYGIEITTALP